jgi:hypothetical protein
LAGWPVEKYECDDELRHEQQIRKQLAVENGRLFHSGRLVHSEVVAFS